MENQREKRSGLERRKYPRLSIPVLIHFSIGKESLERICVAKNIGAGGICLIVPEEIPTQTILALRINMPEEKDPIQAKGKVVWSQGISYGPGKIVYYNSAGIEFTEIADSDRQRISKFVSDHVDKNQT